MKPKKILFAVFTLFLLTGVTSCEINNDDDICTFNVDDPINDLEWLKSKIPTTTSPDYSISFYLYQNKKNHDKYYFVQDFCNNVISAYSRQTVYNCKGNKLMVKGIEGPTPTGWDEFFDENTLVRLIWPNE